MKWLSAPVYVLWFYLLSVKKSPVFDYPDFNLFIRHFSPGDLKTFIIYENTKKKKVLDHIRPGPGPKPPHTDSWNLDWIIPERGEAL